MIELKNMLYQIENLRKKTGKQNFVKPQNTETFSYKFGEKYQKGHNDKCKAIGKTCYSCRKMNHL